MQLHIVIQQNPLLNKANLKEKKKKKKNNLPRQSLETGEAASACSLEQQDIQVAISFLLSVATSALTM